MPPPSPAPAPQGTRPDPAALSTGAAPESLAGRVAGFRAALMKDGESLDSLDDQVRLDLLRELELLTRTMGAVGARVQVGFHASQVAAQLEAGIAPSRAGTAVPDDLAHARMTSPYWGSRDLTCAKALCTELPHTLRALTDGVITSYQARIITEATTTLEAADRAEVDERLAARLSGASSKEIEAATRALVYEVDPAGFVKRARKAAAERGLSLRPCPDVMALLSARLPAPQAIAVYQALRAAARAMQAAGDPRTLNQLMVDELYERVTGRTIVDGVDVEVGLVITDLALFEGASTSAELSGYGPIPAELAREILRPHRDAEQDESDPAGSGTADPPQTDGPAPTATTEEIATRARADAAANANGFAGGRAPAGYCPDGGRCTDFSCSLVHGAPAPPGRTPPETSAPVKDAPMTPAGGAATDSGAAGPATDGGARGPATDGGAGAADGDCTDATARAAKVWLRRLFTDPVTGILTGRDPRRRLFTGALRAFLVSRDRTCRNSWCGAPIRHIDHITRHRDEGRTDTDNGRGLCARCNLARERTRHRTPASSDFRGPPPLLDTFYPQRE